MSPMDDELRIVEDELPGGVCRLKLHGELDMIGAPEVEARLEELARGGLDVRLDLSELTFMDSTGVRVLFGAAKARDGEPGTLEIVRPVGEAWRVIELTGLQRVLPFVDD